MKPPEDVNRFKLDSKKHPGPVLLLELLEKMEWVFDHYGVEDEEITELSEAAMKLAKQSIADARAAALWRDAESSLEKVLAELTFNDRNLN